MICGLGLLSLKNDSVRVNWIGLFQTGSVVIISLFLLFMPQCQKKNRATRSMFNLEGGLALR